MINHVGLYDENMLPEAIILHPKYNPLPHRRCGTTGSDRPANLAAATIPKDYLFLEPLWQ